MKEGMKHLSHQMCTSLLNQHCCSLSCSGTDTSGAFQEALVVKNLPANAGDTGFIPRSGRSPGEGKSNPLQYSCLGNPMDGGAWQAAVQRFIKSWTGLNRLGTQSSLFSFKACTFGGLVHTKGYTSGATCHTDC